MRNGHGDLKRVLLRIFERDSVMDRRRSRTRGEEKNKSSYADKPTNFVMAHLRAAASDLNFSSSLWDRPSKLPFDITSTMSPGFAFSARYSASSSEDSNALAGRPRSSRESAICSGDSRSSSPSSW